MEIGPGGAWGLCGTPLSMDTGHSSWRLGGENGELAFDIVFPVLHGPFGEDGTVQGLCRMAGWPFAGAGVMTSSVAMNKSTAKELMRSAGVPVLPWRCFTADGPPSADSLDGLDYPLFVKPARMGSSIGISRIDGPSELNDALKRAFMYDSLILVEQGLESAREIEVALLSESGRVSSSVAGEVVPGLQWYDYRAKYDCRESRLLIPAPISGELSNAIRSAAERAFSMIHGSGYARADFLLDRNGGFYFGEINTIPGFTEISMFPKLWQASGVGAAELIERILAEAMRRFGERAGSSTEVCE